MYRTAHPLFLVCETPLHAGSGKDLGVVDLPIQRERHTGFPKVEASTLKGSIRESFCYRATQAWQRDNVNLVFGPEKGELHAAAVGFSDARLLLFPVKSVRGVFAFVTCPRILDRFRADLATADVASDITIPPDFAPQSGQAYLLSGKSTLPVGEKLILEEYAFDIVRPAAGPTVDGQPLGEFLAAKLFQEMPWWQSKLRHDLVVLSDNDFGDFAQLSTEVITRTKINSETGTVAQGQLFTEEFLPSDSVLYSLALTAPLFSTDAIRGENDTTHGRDQQAVLKYLKTLDPTIQMGGDATLGKGIVRTHLLTPKTTTDA